MPIVRWVLLDLSCYKVGHLQLQPLIKWKWYIRDQDQVGPEDTRKLHEEMANFQWFLLLLQCLLLSSIYLWSIPYDYLNEKR